MTAPQEGPRKGKKSLSPTPFLDLDDPVSKSWLQLGFGCELTGSSGGTPCPTCGTTSNKAGRHGLPGRPRRGLVMSSFHARAKRCFKVRAGWDFPTAQVTVKLGKCFSQEGDVKDQSGTE